MPDAKNVSIWTTAGPKHWPPPPEKMTVSTLLEIEACPRRWSLSSAAYPHFWKRAGYPPRLQYSGLTGTVVHLALEETIRVLVRAGCPSLDSAEAVAVMKDLGGYNVLLSTCIDRVLRRHAENPRTAHLLELRRACSDRAYPRCVVRFKPF